MYLIDTHILLWLLSEPQKLSVRATEILEKDENLFISIASLWEIAIKQSNNRLELPFSPFELEQICRERKIKIKAVEPFHLNELKSLPRIHNDPFDRIIICQAKAENIPLVTHDLIIKKYPVKTVW